MSVWTVSGVCLVCVLMGKLLEGQSREYAVGLSLLCGCAVAGVAMSALLPIRDQLTALVQGNASLISALSLLMKGLGICYLAGFATNVCKDAGAASYAHYVEWIARLSLVGLYLPVLLDLAKQVTAWLGGGA